MDSKKIYYVCSPANKGYIDLKKNIIVIGAGASGMMAAGHAAVDNNVTIIEKNSKVGRKIMISGKGRCNLTNNCDVSEFLSNVPTNPQFLYSALNNFSPSDTINFFEKRGLPLKTERGNRIFPKSDKASDVVDVLYNFIVNAGVKIIKNSRVNEIIIKNECVKGVILSNGKTLYADSVILAAGGASYPLTGSEGDGYVLAEKAGHIIIPLRPALAPLELEGDIHEKLQGLSLKNVKLSLINENKILYNELGEMIFTHFGVSGPLVLAASSNFREISPEKYTINLDLKPGLDENQLDKRLLRDFTKNTNKDFINSLSALIPQKLIPVIVQLSGINERQKTHQITAEQRKKLLSLLKNFCFKVKKLRPIEEAIVTGGGVKTSEINPKTMESKLVKGLYLTGEIIDVDGLTGGFNMQIAFSTGIACGV